MALTYSSILRINLMAEQYWKDSALMNAYIAHSDTALAQKRNQITKFQQLQDKGRENTVRVMWIDPCGQGVQDCTPTCDITGAVPATSGQELTMDLCKESVPFAVDEEVMRNNEYTTEQATAAKLALSFKALDEWWSQQLLLKYKAFAGPNFFPNTFTQSDGTTYIPDAGYDVTLLPYLIRAGIMNQMADTYIIDDGELFNSITTAGLNSNNLNGQGAATMAQQLQSKLTFDMWNFAKAAITEDTFIIDRSAVLWLTKSRFETTPKFVTGTVKPQWRWSQASPLLPGITYDVYSEETCTTVNGSADEHIVHNFKIKTRGGIWNNPIGCSQTLNGVTGQGTGVISLTKGVDPTP